jgi:hypothetical protein
MAIEREVALRIEGVLFNPDHLLKLQAKGDFARMGDRRDVWQCYLGAPAEALFMVHDFDEEFDGDYNVTYIIAPGEDFGLHMEAHVYETIGSGSATYTAAISKEGVVNGWQLGEYE